MNFYEIGIITDIHHNVVALKAVLHDLEEVGYDEVLCCGDIMGIGADPEEAVQIIKSNEKIPSNIGNQKSNFVND